MGSLGRTIILQEQKKPSIAVYHYGETSPGAFQKILKLTKIYTSILYMDLAVTFVA